MSNFLLLLFHHHLPLLLVAQCGRGNIELTPRVWSRQNQPQHDRSRKQRHNHRSLDGKVQDEFEATVEFQKLIHRVIFANYCRTRHHQPRSMIVPKAATIIEPQMIKMVPMRSRLEILVATKSDENMQLKTREAEPTEATTAGCKKSTNSKVNSFLGNYLINSRGNSFLNQN